MAEHTSASADDVRRAAEGWDEDQLECRMYAHSWRPHTAQRDKRVNLIKVVQICQRCDTQKHQEINSNTGEVFASWYVYGEGYLSKGIGRITGDGRNVLRLEAVGRIFKITNKKMTPHSKAAREAQATEPTPLVRKAS